MAANFERRIRQWLKGVPSLSAPSHEVLRGRHQGKTILVHGNGPSCVEGYELARQQFGNELIVVGMNASLKLIAPDYYLLVDRKATPRYAALVDPEKQQLIISQQALTLVDGGLRKRDPQLYQHILSLCKHANTIQLDRSKKSAMIDPGFSVLPGDSANGGVIAICLALMMLLPKLTAAGIWAGEILPGRLVVTGMDGYPLGPDDVQHIDPGSPPPGDALVANLYQSAYMAQLFTLAATLGMDVVNLNQQGALPVNDLFRSNFR